MGLSHGAAPPSAGVKTSVLRQVSQASPEAGAEGDCAHAEVAQANPRPPVFPQAHASSALANVWYPDECTWAQHCWQLVFVDCPAHVMSVGPF